MLSEDMLLLENERVGILLDLGWYWDSQEYGLGAYRWFKDKELSRESWRHPLAEYRTRSTDEVAEMIDAWLAKYSKPSYVVPALSEK